MKGTINQELQTSKYLLSHIKTCHKFIKSTSSYWDYTKAYVYGLDHDDAGSILSGSNKSRFYMSRTHKLWCEQFSYREELSITKIGFSTSRDCIEYMCAYGACGIVSNHQQALEISMYLNMLQSNKDNRHESQI